MRTSQCCLNLSAFVMRKISPSIISLVWLAPQDIEEDPYRANRVGLKSSKTVGALFIRRLIS